MPNARYEIRSFPRSRRLVVDACEWGRKKHIVHALAEFDVTRARELIRNRKIVSGEALSFTAFVAASIGRAVAEDRMCHAYRRGNKLILFDDVDIATPVEHDVEGAKLATLYVIRAADKKSPFDIHHEIRAAQKQNVESAPGVHKWEMFLYLPAVIRRLLYRFMDAVPEYRQRLGGTVVLTAVGMAGRGAGWGIPISSSTLTVVLGGIETKPGIIDGRIEAREFLSVTVSFDHDIVDGVPAARFVARLRELVERACGLEDNPSSEAACIGARPSGRTVPIENLAGYR